MLTVTTSDLLRPAMKDGYLAPTVQQRMRYLDWLNVYAKDQTKLPARMAVLVDDYTVLPLFELNR
jgi:hypothetical protein